MMGDYNRLKQVLVNVLKNSIEAMENVESKILTVETCLKEQDFLIKVKDSGEGISKENLKKLKDPFFTTKVRGTGLGVYLSNEIIRAHHGSLDYDSVEGEGTMVLISLHLMEK